ncbi:MAG: response regulator transcription factor [Candidatus Nanopelagicales bacterium]
MVDDEPQIRHILRAYLEKDGYGVDEAGTAADALGALHEAAPPFALVILDVGLPDTDGVEVLRLLRAQPRTADLPVILVTARAEEVDKLVGLAVGADDYVTKPFSPREVVARVKTVLRRVGPSPSHRTGILEAADPRAATAAEPGQQVLRFDGLVLDRSRRELSLAGDPVELSALEFDILAALAESPGRVFSRVQLLDKVWGYDFYGDERVVDVHIRSIRKALRDDASAPRIIGTVRGVGYKMILPPMRPR